jgi:hypothetical protein
MLAVLSGGISSQALTFNPRSSPAIPAWSKRPILLSPGWRPLKPLHAVASKYFLAALAQLRPVLLQALLNRPVVAQLLSAKALCIAAASSLLLRRAHVTLC